MKRKSSLNEKFEKSVGLQYQLRRICNQRGVNITGNNRTSVHLGPVYNLCRVVTVCYLQNTRS
jgi:hypothetical protein